MSFLAKRISEVIIIATIMMFIIFRGIEKDRYQHHSETKGDRFAVLNQELWDQYGPGSRYAYDKVFDPESYEKYVNGNVDLVGYKNPWEKVFETLDAANASGVIEGILAVDEAPDWFDERLDAAEELITALDEAFETGLYITSPNEIYFNNDIMNSPNFLYMQKTAKVLRHYAMRQWQQGDRTEAINTIHKIIQIGDALQAEKSLIAHLIRIAVFDMGLHGMERFLWLEPSLSELELMQEVLLSTDLSTWNYPAYTDRFIWYNFPENPDYVAMAFLLTESPHVDQHFAVKLQDEGVLPRFTLSNASTIAITRKWTTIPAMEKRLSDVPDGYYEGDPLLRPENAKKLPPLLYAAYRYQPNPSGNYLHNVNVRMDVVRNHMKLLRQAVWARIIKEQTGQYPDKERYYNHVAVQEPDEENNFAHSVDRGEENHMLIAKFKQIHYSSNHLRKLTVPVKGLEQWDNRKLHYSFNYQPSLSQYNLFGNSSAGLNGIELEQEELVNWTSGIFKAFKPFVKSVTVTRTSMRESIQNNLLEAGFPRAVHDDPSFYPKKYDGNGNLIPSNQYLNDTVAAYLTVELDLPKVTHWFVHQGPDSQFNAETISYDPSNGTKSAGDIYQFVGWE